MRWSRVTDGGQRSQLAPVLDARDNPGDSYFRIKAISPMIDPPDLKDPVTPPEALHAPDGAGAPGADEARANFQTHLDGVMSQYDAISEADRRWGETQKRGIAMCLDQVCMVGLHDDRTRQREVRGNRPELRGPRSGRGDQGLHCERPLRRHPREESPDPRFEVGLLTAGATGASDRRAGSARVALDCPMVIKARCRRPESNGGPTDYESVALPSELRRRMGSWIPRGGPRPQPSSAIEKPMLFAATPLRRRSCQNRPPFLGSTPARRCGGLGPGRAARGAARRC